MLTNNRLIKVRVQTNQHVSSMIALTMSPSAPLRALTAFPRDTLACKWHGQGDHYWVPHLTKVPEQIHMALIQLL